MKSVIIGTNGYLRLFLNDIPEQADIVEKIIRQAKKEQIIIQVPSIILFEINFTLKKYYHLEKEEIIELLKTLLAMPYLTVESSDIFTETLLIYKHHNLSLADCFLFAKAKLENAELFTFDNKLKKLQVSLY